MIFWDDFDTRTTKVLCNQCQKDITPQAYAELSRQPWWKFWVHIKPFDTRKSFDTFTDQWQLVFGRHKWVIMKFKHRPEADTRLRGLI